MTERDFAVEVVRRLQSAGFEALFAGGCVRDELLGTVPADYDVATSAPPDTVRDLFKRTIAIGASFGVIEVLGPRGDDGEWLKVQVATFRSDGAYTDGRRPDSVSFGSAEEDGARRDFTINGLYRDPINDELRDYVGGERDLRNKVLRAIGNPEERFKEDKLRILRAVRMAARFNLDIEPYTEAAMRLMVDQVIVVSAERIAEELRKILKHPSREKGVRLLQSLGLLKVIIPEMHGVSGVGYRALPPDTPFEIGFAMMLWAVNMKTRAAICRRLRFSNTETERILWLCKNRWLLATSRRMRKSQLFPLLAHPGINDLVLLHAADDSDPFFEFHRTVEGYDGTGVEYVRQLLGDNAPETFNPPPLLTGDDLRELGYIPGPAFKRWLENLRAAQLDGEVTDRAGAIEKIAAQASVPS